eukprot:354140-Chlamydomonas_euryale.AAC.8
MCCCMHTPGPNPPPPRRSQASQESCAKQRRAPRPAAASARGLPSCGERAGVTYAPFAQALLSELRHDTARVLRNARCAGIASRAVAIDSRGTRLTPGRRYRPQQPCSGVPPSFISAAECAWLDDAEQRILPQPHGPRLCSNGGDGADRRAAAVAAAAAAATAAAAAAAAEIAARSRRDCSSRAPLSATGRAARTAAAAGTGKVMAPSALPAPCPGPCSLPSALPGALPSGLPSALPGALPSALPIALPRPT